MTKYNLEIPTHGSPLYPWLKVFMGLTIRQFNEIQDSLNFPVKVNNEIHNISLSFAFTHTLLFDQTAWENHKSLTKSSFITKPDASNVNILVDPDSDIPYEDQINMLFEKTFSLLDELSYGEEIFEWGRNTHTYLKLLHREEFLHINSLRAWYSLLGSWAIREYKRNLFQSEKVVSAWNILKQELELNSNGKVESNILDLSLSSSSKLRLIEAILFDKSQRFSVMKIIDRLPQAPLNQWEDYVLRTNVLKAWFSGEVRYRMDLRLINLIRQLLSESEIQRLEEWGLQHQANYPELTTPIPNLNA